MNCGTSAPQHASKGEADYDAYGRHLKEARRRHADQLSIVNGTELDYQKRFEGEIRDWLAHKPFDLVLGSVHYLDGHRLSDETITAGELDDICFRYLEEVRLSAASELFGAIGHLDYVTKFTGDPS